MGPSVPRSGRDTSLDAHDASGPTVRSCLHSVAVASRAWSSGAGSLRRSLRASLHPATIPWRHAVGHRERAKGRDRRRSYPRSWRIVSLVPGSVHRTTVTKVLARLSATWHVPWLESVTLAFVARRRASLGSSNARSRTIRLDERLRRRPALLAEIVCHEAAHLVAFARSNGRARPHGPEWRRLVLAAGYDPRAQLPPLSSPPPAAPPNRPRFEHVCPVCHARRVASRRVLRWRCASCIADGLDGTLEIRRVEAPRSP